MVSTPAAPTTATAVPPREHDHERLTLGLWLIIIFKGITAILLWGAFILLLAARRDDPRNFFGELVFRTFRGNPPEIAIRFLARNTEFISHALVTRIAIATAAYALVESAESVGLFLRKRWAEWLVILVTVSFIPVEIYEIVLRPNPLKIGTLIANVVILWYLLKRMYDKRAQQRRAILDQS